MAKKKQITQALPKRFYVPNSVKVLGSYANTIINSMYNEYQALMERSKNRSASRSAVKASFKRRGNRGKPKSQ